MHKSYSPKTSRQNPSSRKEPDIEMAVEDEEDELQQQSKRIMKFHSSESNHSILKEVVIEILLRLPVECLLRCKSVCKSWYSLVSDPQFVKCHLRLSTSRKDYVHHRLMFLGPGKRLNTRALHNVMHDKSVSLLELDCPFECPGRNRIVGCCNGLVCLRGYGDGLYIWNPSTKRSHSLPCFDFIPQFYGFGYDESSEDYKVVVMSCCGGKVNMYSFKSAKWKKISDFPWIIDDSPYEFPGAFCNDTLHWVVWPIFGPHLAKVVSLDLATTTFGEILQPVCDRGYEDLRIKALGEWLFLLYDYCGDQTDVWMMKVYGDRGSWTKLVSIQSTIHCLEYPTPCFAGDGKILLECDEKLVQHDVKNGSISKIKNFGGSILGSLWTIVESLVSPGGPLRPSRRRGRKPRNSRKVGVSIGK